MSILSKNKTFTDDRVFYALLRTLKPPVFSMDVSVTELVLELYRQPHLEKRFENDTEIYIAEPYHKREDPLKRDFKVYLVAKNRNHLLGLGKKAVTFIRLFDTEELEKDFDKKLSDAVQTLNCKWDLKPPK